MENKTELLPWQKDSTFSAKTVILISFGFFATSAAWSIYNSNVNRMLNDLIGNIAIVGFLMTIDNIIGVFIQPLTGSMSDKTKSKFGRRMPFVLIGLPISAITFVFIPLVADNLVLLLIVMFIFNLSMAFWRAPVVALMPDFVAPKDRSKGNGIVNFLGGFGAVFAFAVGGILIGIDMFLGFVVISIIMFGALGVLILGVKEPDTRDWEYKEEDSKKSFSMYENFKEVATASDKSTLFMLLAIFFWFLGYQGLEALWTIYAGEFFALGSGPATFSLTFVALTFMVFAIPAGLIAKKLSRKKTIMIGLAIGTVVLFIANFIKGVENIMFIYIIFVVFGICWAMININSIAMIWQMAPTAKHIGIYTGLYYFFSFFAAILGPTIIGSLMEYVVGNGNMFIICSIFMFMALIFMIRVKKGEILTKDEENAKQQAIQEVDRD